MPVEDEKALLQKLQVRERRAGIANLVGSIFMCRRGEIASLVIWLIFLIPVVLVDRYRRRVARRMAEIFSQGHTIDQ